jgi:tagatose 6-phosphate kinase
MCYLTITLNPALDTTYRVANFRVNETHRTTGCHRQAGGKGINVARVLTDLGQRVMAAGFLAGTNGSAIEADVGAAGITPAFTWLPTGESRMCIAIVDDISGNATEVLETGPVVSDAAVAALSEVVATRAPQAIAVVISGSAPPGMTPAQIASIGKVARANTSCLVVDASGDALQTLLGCRPDLVKPNRPELQTLLAHPLAVGTLPDASTLAPVFARLAPGGQLLVSLGEAGAMLFDGTILIRAWMPLVPIVNPVGCGDALVAGYLTAEMRGDSPGDALRAAVATATAAAMEPFAGHVNPSTIDRFLPQVHLDHLTDSVQGSVSA